MTPDELTTSVADDATAATLDEVSLWSSRFGALLLEQMPLARGLRVVDLGCGTGFPTLELAGLLGPGSRVVGVDTWAAGLARARAKLRVHPAPAAFVRADAARLPFPAARFDLAVSNLGVNNFPDFAGVLAEAARVLRPGGRIALTTNPRGHLQELYETFRHVIDESGAGPDAAARLEAEEEHRLGAERIEELLAGAGFHPGHVVSREVTLRYASGAAFLRHPLTRFGFLDGLRRIAGAAPDLLPALERALDEVAAAEGELRLTLPLLYLDAVRGD